MRIILDWLADFAWVVYAACGLAALVYLARALSVQRRLSGTLTRFERETMSAQAGRLWRLTLTSLLVGLVLFVGQAYLLPQVLPEGLLGPTPTPWAGLVITPSPRPSPTATPIVGVLPTVAPTLALIPPSPPVQATPTQTPVPSGPAPAYPLYARLGDVAEFLGYDLPSTEVRPGQTLLLILYWRALSGAGAANYAVFTHLLPPDMSRLLGQHDGVPAGGSSPTTTWVAGEVIVDAHELTLYETGYSGPAQIAVGLYDPVTQLRVPVEGSGNYILLPTGITVVVP